MDLHQALQEFEKVMPADGTFVSYNVVYGQLMTSNEGRAAVPHIHDLRRAELIRVNVVTDESGKLEMFIARQLGGE